MGYSEHDDSGIQDWSQPEAPEVTGAYAHQRYQKQQRDEAERIEAAAQAERDKIAAEQHAEVEASQKRTVDRLQYAMDNAQVLADQRQARFAEAVAAQFDPDKPKPADHLRNKVAEIRDRKAEADKAVDRSWLTYIKTQMEKGEL